MSAKWCKIELIRSLHITKVVFFAMTNPKKIKEYISLQGFFLTNLFQFLSSFFNSLGLCGSKRWYCSLCKTQFFWYINYVHIITQHCNIRSHGRLTRYQGTITEMLWYIFKDSISLWLSRVCSSSIHVAGNQTDHSILSRFHRVKLSCRRCVR